jgi:hypothetical protein
MSWDNTLQQYKSDPQKPTAKMFYRVRWSGDTKNAAVTSSNTTISVTPSITINASNYSVSKGTNVKISGAVSPNHAGKTVYLQRYTSSGWINHAYQALNSTSNYAFYWKPGTAGSYKFRLKFPGDADHKLNYSREITITVK